MPYPTRLLNENETLALDLHPHWWFFSEPVAALVGSIVLGIVALTQDGNVQKVLGYISLAALVISVIWVLARYATWATTHFVITSDRMIFRHGVFAKSGIEIPLGRVNNVNFSQSVFERILGAGDLLIESAGVDGRQRFTDIRHPEKVQNLIHAQTAASEQRRVGGEQPATDVATQLEKLEGLLERGSLTPEEFEEQKRRLLG